MFLWNKLAKTAQKDKRNFRVSKVIVIIMKIIILWKKSVVFFLIFRSSRSQIFFKIDVLKNFATSPAAAFVVFAAKQRNF